MRFKYILLGMKDSKGKFICKVKRQIIETQKQRIKLQTANSADQTFWTSSLPIFVYTSVIELFSSSSLQILNKKVLLGDPKRYTAAA